MLGHNFFHDTIRKYVSGFGTLFNDIKLSRTNRLGQVIETIEVPLTYGPRDKFVTRLQQDPDLAAATAISLPRISFELVRMQYDPGRMTPAINKMTGLSRPEKVNTVFEYVPYDFQFSVNVYTKTNEDGVRIVEQILPFFVPQFTPTMQLLDDPVVKMDTPIILGGVNTSDVYDGAFDQRRVLVHTLDFILKGVVIGPVIERPLILTANTNIRIDEYDEAIGSSNDYIYETVSITPGQYANGLAFSNTGTANTNPGSVSVSANTIYPNSDWGYVISHEYNIE